MYISGFYDRENDGVRDFRWMRQKAQVVLENCAAEGYLMLTLAAPSEAVLRIRGDKETCCPLVGGWQTKYVPMDAVVHLEGTNTLELESDARVEGIEDSRELSLMVSEIRRIPAEDMPALWMGTGFYSLEHDGRRDFRWMGNDAKIRIFKSPQEGEYLLLDAGSVCEEECVTLSISCSQGNSGQEFRLFPGWQTVGIPLHADGTAPVEVSLHCDWEHAAAKDERTLSLMISRVRVEVPNAFDQNAIQVHESLLRDTVCNTMAWCFACDTSAVCNLHCAYCCLDTDIRGHDGIKGAEAVREVIVSYLPYAAKIQPYLSGEPFLREDMWEVLEEAGKSVEQYPFREVEFSTNGLLLDERMAERVLRSDITSLLVSVNAARARTYRRIQGGILTSWSGT